MQPHCNPLLDKSKLLLRDSTARQLFLGADLGNMGHAGPFQEVLDAHRESLSEYVQHGQRWIRFAGFHPTHVGPEDSASFSKFLLGHAAFGTQLAYSQPQGLLNIDSGLWHPVSLGLVYLFVHTLIVTLGERMSDSMNVGVTVFCNQCGHKNAPGFNFCQSCGAASTINEVDTEVAPDEVSVAEPPMTLLKATAYYAAAILIHIVLFKVLPERLLSGVAWVYVISGFVMTRVVMRGLIEWHPNYNTLHNVVSAKLSMFVLWPIQMPALLFKLMVNKVM